MLFVCGRGGGVGGIVVVAAVAVVQAADALVEGFLGTCMNR